VFNNYLKQAGIPEVHIYDRDKDCKYQADCDRVNSRGDGSSASLTGKLEMESYLHPEVINAVFGIKISFADIDAHGGDVPALVVARVKEDKRNPMREKIRPGKKPSDLCNWENETKAYLNSEVAQRMTLEMLDESDPARDIEGWLRKISELLP
jgi:hypothetical protein